MSALGQNVQLDQEGQAALAQIAQNNHQQQIQATTGAAEALGQHMQALSDTQKQQLDDSIAPIKEELAAVNAMISNLPEQFKAQGEQVQGFLGQVMASLQQNLAQQAAQGKADMQELASGVRQQMETFMRANEALAAMTQGLSADLQKQLGVLPGLHGQLQANQDELKAGMEKLAVLNSNVFQGTAMAHEAAMQNANALSGLMMNLASVMQGSVDENAQSARNMAAIAGQMRENQQRQQQLTAEQERANAQLISSLSNAINGVGTAAQEIANLKGDIGALNAGLRVQMDKVLSGVTSVPQMATQLKLLSGELNATMPGLAREISGALGDLDKVMRDLAKGKEKDNGGQTNVTVTLNQDGSSSAAKDGIGDLRQALIAGAKDEVTTAEQKDAEIDAVGLMARKQALESQINEAKKTGADSSSIQNELEETDAQLAQKRRLADERTKMQTLVATKNWIYSKLEGALKQVNDPTSFFRQGVLPVAGAGYNAVSALAYMTTGTHVGSLPVTTAQWDKTIGKFSKTISDLSETKTNVTEAFMKKDIAQKKDKLNLLEGQIVHGNGNGSDIKTVADAEALKKSIATAEGKLQLLQESKADLAQSNDTSMTVEVTTGKKRGREGATNVNNGRKKVAPKSSEPPTTSLSSESGANKKKKRSQWLKD